MLAQWSEKTELQNTDDFLFLNFFFNSVSHLAAVKVYLL